MKRNVTHAVHEHDLVDLLRSLGVMELIQLGKTKCYFCEEKVTLENLQCIFPNQRKIEFCCQKISCFTKVVEMRRELK